jgi:hypothetical protein
MDEVLGVEPRKRAACGKPLPRNPLVVDWDRAYCSVACRKKVMR